MTKQKNHSRPKGPSKLGVFHIIVMVTMMIIVGAILMHEGCPQSEYEESPQSEQKSSVRSKSKKNDSHFIKFDPSKGRFKPNTDLTPGFTF